MDKSVPAVPGVTVPSTSQPGTAAPIATPVENFGVIPVAPVTQIYPEFNQIKSLPVPQEFASVISPGNTL